MATHTLQTDHHLPGEDKVDEEVVKPAEEDVVSSSKQSEDTPKAEESPSPATLVSKSEKGAEDEQIKTQVEKVAEKDCALAAESLPHAVKSKSEEQPTVESAVKEAEEQTLQEIQEQPKIVDIPEPSKEVDKPDSVVPKVEAKVDTQSEQVTEKVEVISTEVKKLDSVVPEVEAKIEAQSEQVTKKVEIVSTEVEKPDSAIPQVEAKLEAQSEKVTGKVETVSTEVEKPDPVVPEVETKLEGQSEQLPKKVDTVSAEAYKLESVFAEVDAKLEEKSEVAEKVETVSTEVEKPVSVVPETEAPSEVSEKVKDEEVEPKENVAGGDIKDERTLADKVKDFTSLKEEKTEKQEEPSVCITSEQDVSKNQEPEAAQKEDEVQSLVPDVTEKKELSGLDAVESLSKEAVVTMEQVREENEPKTTETDGGNEGKNVTEESTQPIIGEGVNRTDADVTEKVLTGENIGKDNDVELVKNGNEEIVKDEKPVIVESNKNGQTEEKLDDATIAVSEPFKELPKSELEVKDRESLDTVINKLEVSKDSDGTKTSQHLPKEAPAKPTQKQSNNIISKVKQSLVKAKKAIIGKSPNSKTVSSQTKDDIKVK